METSIRMHVNEIDFSFFEAFKKLYKNKEICISISEVPNHISQIEMFKASEKLQKKYPPKKIDPSIDLSALANEVNL